MKKKLFFMLPNRLRNGVFVLAAFFLIGPWSLFCADDKAQDSAKKTTTQQIGGLLFDVDEGVKIEKGSGGSVYMKSNKEYMQEKFSMIDEKLAALDIRLAKLEKKDVTTRAKENKDGNHKVLVS